MKISGKALLFMSSYLPVWLFWIIIPIFTLGTIQGRIMFTLGIVLTVLSFFTIYYFSKTYETANRNNAATIYITDVSSGSSEAISYLLTLVIPAATSAIPFQILGGTFDQNVIVTLILSLGIFYIYLKSNLVVMNPLMMSQYSLYIINFKPTKESDVSFDSVLIAKKAIDLQDIKSQNQVTKVDQGVYLLRGY